MQDIESIRFIGYKIILLQNLALENQLQSLFLATLVAVLFTTRIRATVRTTASFDGTNVNFSTIDKTLKISVRNVKAEPVSIFLEDTEGVSLVSETIEYHFVKMKKGRLIVYQSPLCI